ncbi:hypothetical protein [Fischerella thermalis]|uniref:hypothetical protein n=1 Tax=Fischerella thermalis TaxID=372787 RepID=UPI0019E14EF8|nr:hypothetical protein [Fischerella thermalis]MBF2059339.1 hypothetical protein [Fischerella thermalis M66_A2018_004]
MIEPSLERRLTSAQEAITVLQRDFAPVAIQKPAISKIRLTKDGNYLKIFIPPVGFHPLFGMGSLFAIAWNSFILLWTVGVMLTPFPSNIPLALISLPFWGASFLMGNTVLFSVCFVFRHLFTSGSKAHNSHLGNIRLEISPESSCTQTKNYQTGV